MRARTFVERVPFYVYIVRLMIRKWRVRTNVLARPPSPALSFCWQSASLPTRTSSFAIYYIYTFEWHWRPSLNQRWFIITGIYSSYDYFTRKFGKCSHDFWKGSRELVTEGSDVTACAEQISHPPCYFCIVFWHVVLVAGMLWPLEPMKSSPPVKSQSRIKISCGWTARILLKNSVLFPILMITLGKYIYN